MEEAGSLKERMIPLKHAQSLVGYIILVVGIFLALTMGSLTIGLLSVTAGMILLALGKLIGIAEEIQYKVLEIPSTHDQIRTVIKNSPQYLIESSDFELYPNKETRYPLILLDDEYYIRARIFYKYLSQVQNDYTFKLPEQEPVTLHRSDHYYKGVELFAYEEQVIVMLRKIRYTPTVVGNKLILERGTP